MDSSAKLLKLLKSAKGPVSGEELSARLGITRSAIWKHVESLREAGFVIKATPHGGYTYEKSPDALVPEEIQSLLTCKTIGQKIISYASLDSTNRLAMEMAEKGAPEGLVIFAEHQTHGKGRQGRTWVSPKAKGLYFSVILRPKIQIQELPKITLMAAVAVARALADESGLSFKIRWPNDLLLDGKKICGILTEMRAEPDRVRHVVLGIGVNINSSRRDLPDIATSLKEATGKAWNRCRIAARILENIEEGYRKISKGEFSDLAHVWEELSAVSGKRVTAKTLGGAITGTAVGIDEDGALWIRQDTGLQTKVVSGDILFLR